MVTVPIGVSVSTTVPSSLSLSKTPSRQTLCNLRKSSASFSSTLIYQSSSLTKSDVCKASQVAELFPTVYPQLVIREARLEDSWEAAETHCASFFPRYSFPLDFMLRLSRLVAMLSPFSLPNGCNKTRLVAVAGAKIGDFDGGFCFNKGYVTGILTVDTLADFLPRKGPLQQRRMGIAYISNVAVRSEYRQKGIAKKLVTRALTEARKWGCRAIALHCDEGDPSATKLYGGQGFKRVKVPRGASWPQPKSSPHVRFCFMIKLLHSPSHNILYRV